MKKFFLGIFILFIFLHILFSITNKIGANKEIILYVFLSFLPFILFLFFIFKLKNSWQDYIDRKSFLNKKRILLEIRVPKEITKTPQAMETFFDAIYDVGREAGFKKKWLEGKGRPVFSFEIVSNEGNTSLYIWTEDFYKNAIESHLYANYPSVEIVEVLDYSKFVSFDVEKDGLFAFEFKLKKEDPYPIKTYKAFELDKVSNPDQIEQRTDPLAPILESLSNVKKNEYMWIQIVLRGHKKGDIKKPLKFFNNLLPTKDFFKFFYTFKTKEDIDWKDEANEIVDEYKKKVITGEDDSVFKNSLKKEDELINSVVENAGKTPFEVGIRAMYFAKDGNFRPQNISVLSKIWRSFSSELYNFFSPSFVVDFDEPWHDFKNIRINKLKEEMFDDYKRRKYFTDKKSYLFKGSQKKYKTFVLSSEELATIFHPPSEIVSSQIYEKIDSKRGGSPKNLPI